MIYKRCGNSGIKLPAISLGLWHNFGGVDTLNNQKQMLFKAFDLGITHFDLANNYGPPCLIHQPSYSMFNRWIEDGLTDVLKEQGIGCITFSPLAQGLLTNKYLNGIPADSRAARSHGFLSIEEVSVEVVAKISKLNDIAANRGQSLAQMAVAWILRLPGITSVLVGTSKVSQIEDNVAALNNLEFNSDELSKIDLILEG